MLAQRLIVAIIIVPVLVLLAYFGGWVFAIALAAVFGLAAWEYCHLFALGGYHPPALLLVVGVAGFMIIRHALPDASGLAISVFIFTTMTWQVVQYEKGSSSSAVDFGITLGGFLYLGWLGSYFVSLRDLSDGLWWFLIVIPAINCADAGAYFIGSRFGKHKMSRLVSPKKSWEGYLGGLVTGTLGSMALAALWHLAAPSITAGMGCILGLVISIIAPIGDLGESMLKRSFGVKDSSHLLGAHGGILDRFDSWLWAAPIGYTIIVTFFF